MTRKIEKAKLIVVEGRDEEFFFDALLVHLNRDDVQVLPIGGKTMLGDNLQALILDPRFPNVDALIVVRDADSTPPNSNVSAFKRAWESVSAALQNAALPVPVEHATLSADSPRTGIFIMPDGQNDGMLESLCLTSVSDQPEYPCVVEYFQCLAKHSVQPNNLDKGRAHAYLASRVEPDKRVGEAAQAGYWPWKSDTFLPLVDFVKQM